jgi:DNA repair exonuclease SbcCD ATPase subunit
MDIFAAFEQLKAALAELTLKLADTESAVTEAKKASYDQGFADGVASVPATGGEDKLYTQAELDAKLAEAVSTSEAKVAELAEKVSALEAQIAAIPPDTTPYAQADVDAAVLSATDSLKATIADLEIKLSQKDTDALEEAIADELAAMAQKLRDRSPTPAVPVEG